MESAFVVKWGTEQGLREGRALKEDGTPVEGTGTGSWIVRKYLEALGWQLRIESTPGVGSKFIITIPEGDLMPASEIRTRVVSPPKTNSQ